MSSDNETVCVRFEKGDLVLLNALIERERLKRSDVIRRAVRAYAEQLGVVPKRKR